MRRITTSLRLRLLLGTLLWIVVSIAATGWLLQQMFSDHLARQFDHELNIHLNQLAASIEFDVAGNLSVQPLSDPRLQQPYSGLYWQIDALPGPGASAQNALRRSRSLWDSRLQVQADQLGDGELHTHQITGPNGETLRLNERIFRLEERPQQPLRLLVAANEQWLQQPLQALRAPLFGSLGVLACGLLLAAFFQVWAGLRPLSRLRRELSTLREGGRSALGRDHPAEIQPLVDELNTVLQNNSEFAERARLQAGNLAHAVKTPLAVMANAAQAEDTPLGHLIREQVALASAEIDRHLNRARSAARARHAPGRCAVKPLAEGLVRVMQKVHGERALDFNIQLSDSLEFRGQAEDLQEMLGNLIDNACKWARQRVSIRAGQEQGRDYLDIDDDGPGIPEAQRPLVLQRGRRADEQTPGSGLGLAIVDDLANQCGCRLELLSSPEQGCRARLWLAPRSSAQPAG